MVGLEIKEAVVADEYVPAAQEITASEVDEHAVETYCPSEVTVLHKQYPFEP